MYYLNARYYSPKWRRFISPDDTAYLDPEAVNGLNLYCYCNNDPVNYADPSGHFLLATFLICVGVGAVIGGFCGGVSAAANGQNIFAGVVIGAIAGGIMGAGAYTAGLFLASACVGNAAVVGGVTYSAGTAFAVGSSIAFGSGAIGGMFADAATQIVNDGGVHDWTSVMISGVQWGTINTVGAFMGSFMGPISELENILLSGFFGGMTSLVGMAIDILRTRKNEKKRFSFHDQPYACSF